MAGNKAAVKYEFYDVPVRERERRAWYQGVGVEQVHTVYLGSGARVFCVGPDLIVGLPEIRFMALEHRLNPSFLVGICLILVYKAFF